MPIDWGALQTPDFTGSALAAYRVGGKMRAEHARENALAKYRTDPEGAIADLTAAGDIETAEQLRKSGEAQKVTKARAGIAPKIAAGDYAGAAKDIAGVDPEYATRLMDWHNKASDQEKKTFDSSNEVIASAFPTLKQFLDKGDAEGARNFYRTQVAPALLQVGAPEKTVQGFDPTDVNALTTRYNLALGAKEILAADDRDRNYSLREKQFGEIRRHNQRTEANSAYSAQTGRMSFQERKKQHGFGTPGGQVIADDDVEIDP